MLARSTQRAIEIVALYILLSGMFVVSTTPLLWSISTSLKIAGKEFVIPIELVPRPVTLDNYRVLFSKDILGFARALVNSAKVTIPTTVGVLFMASLAGFSFAKLKFPLRDAIFLMLLSTMMVPAAVTLIPRYLLMKQLKWLNTYYPLIVPAVLTPVYGTFLMRQFFSSLPNDLLDSARVEGCDPFYMYGALGLPLARPALVTLGIITFNGTWNELFASLIYLTRPRLFTIQQSLAFLNSEYGVEWRLLMSGATVSVVPVVIIFLALQKYYVQGITLSGLKG